MSGEWKKALEAVKDTAKRAELEKALSEVGELADELDKGYMRQADYSRQTQELKSKREELQSKWETANTEYQTMLADYSKVVEDLDSTKAEKEEAARKLAEAEDKLKKTQTVDTSKFLTAEDFAKKQQEFAAGQTAYFGRTLKIMREHSKLFGNDLDPEEFIQEAIAAKKTPDELWEEKYQVKAKRKELADAEAKRRDDDAEKRGYEKRLAEEANPNTRTLDASKQPFYESAKDGKSLQPWDAEEVPDAERDFVKELQQARV
jgi:DNA repair exonuclease SbcCD ATPase subunit